MTEGVIEGVTALDGCRAGTENPPNVIVWIFANLSPVALLITRNKNKTTFTTCIHY
jgi:hypothetical protein